MTARHLGDFARALAPSASVLVLRSSLLALSLGSAWGCRAEEGLEVDVAVSRERVMVTVREEGACWPTSGWVPLGTCQSHVHELNRPGCRPSQTCARAARLVQNGKELARSEQHPFELVVEDTWSGTAFVELEGCEAARPIEVELPPEPAAEVVSVALSDTPYAVDVHWATTDAATEKTDTSTEKGSPGEGWSTFARTQMVILPLAPGAVFQGNCHVPGSVGTGLFPEREPDAVRRLSTLSFLVGPPSTRKGGLGTYRVWTGESWAAELFVPPQLDEDRWSLQFGVTTLTLGDERYVLVDTLSAFSYAGDEPLLELSGTLVREDGQLFNEYQGFSLQAGSEVDEIRVLRGAEWLTASAEHVSVKATFDSPRATSAELDYGDLTFEGVSSDNEVSLAVRVQVDSFPIAQAPRP